MNPFRVRLRSSFLFRHLLNKSLRHQCVEASRHAIPVRLAHHYLMPKLSDIFSHHTIGKYSHRLVHPDCNFLPNGPFYARAHAAISVRCARAQTHRARLLPPSYLISLLLTSCVHVALQSNALDHLKS